MKSINYFITEKLSGKNLYWMNIIFDRIGHERVLYLFYEFADIDEIRNCYKSFCDEFNVEFNPIVVNGNNKDDIINQIDYDSGTAVELEDLVISHINSLDKKRIKEFINFINTKTKLYLNI